MTDKSRRMNDLTEEEEIKRAREYFGDFPESTGAWKLAATTVIATGGKGIYPDNDLDLVWAYNFIQDLAGDLAKVK